MKNIYCVLLVFFAMSGICSSCSSSDEKHEYTELEDNLNFGKGTYRPNPFKILDSIPPFLWMGMPDSVKKATELEIAFNEDAIRSKSTAQIAFVDMKGNKIEGIQVVNPHGSTPFFKADTAQTIIPVTFTVTPNIGDSILNGLIVVLGTDLDEANGISLNTTSTPVATWSLEYETGINWWRWTVFILIVAAVLCLFVLIIYLLYHGVIWVVSVVSELSSYTIPSFGIKLGRTKINKGKNGKKKKDKKNEEETDPIIQELLALEQQLYSNIGISSKYDILEQMRVILDNLYNCNIETYNKARKCLKTNTWEALEEAWKLWDQCPTNNVDWSGNNQTVCTLKHSHPQYEACYNLNFITCSYDMHGSPDFSFVTFPKSIVNVSDLYDILSSEQIKKRGGSRESFQEIAQERMSIQLRPIIEKWATENNRKPDFYKWRDAHDLVPHEDGDCCTMRLVYRPAHKAFTHRGGVANAINIKNHFS